MRRLYLGELLRAIRYHPAWPEYNMPETYLVQLNVDYKLYFAEAPTLDDIIRDLKAQGFQIWGKHPMDYFAPRTAAEKWLYDYWLKHQESEATE